MTLQEVSDRAIEELRREHAAEVIRVKVETAQEKVEKLLALIAEGKTVWVRTHLRSWKVDQKIVNKFRAAGCEIFVARGRSFYMRNGKRLDCIDGCRFVLEG